MGGERFNCNRMQRSRLNQISYAAVNLLLTFDRRETFKNISNDSNSCPITIYFDGNLSTSKFNFKPLSEFALYICSTPKLMRRTTCHGACTCPL